MVVGEINSRLSMDKFNNMRSFTSAASYTNISMGGDYGNSGKIYIYFVPGFVFLDK
jgi:hypothetical protein